MTREQVASSSPRWAWTDGFGVRLLQVLVGAMLLLGMGEDIYELFLDDVPWATPDRLFVGPDYEAIAGRGGAWALVGVVPALLDALITLVLVSLGAYLLGLVRHVAGLKPLALICGLAALDHLPHAPATVADIYFSVYWFLLFAAFVRLASVFPRRLMQSEVVSPAVARTGSRVPRRLRAVLAGPDRVWLRAPLLWGVAALMGVLTWRFDDPAAALPTPALAALALATLLILLWWVRAAVRFSRIQYRLASDAERRRLKWFFNALSTYLIGFAMLLVAYVVTANYMAIARPDDGAAHLWLDLSIATAYQVLVAIAVGLLLLSIIRGGALDPGRVFRRINVYYAIVIAGVPLYALTEDMIEWGVEEALSLSPGMATAAAVVLTIPILIWPVREFFDRVFDRLAFAWAPLFESAAVLLCSDVPGYGALLTADAGAALRVSQRLRRASRAVARAHDGRVVRVQADEVLLEFPRSDNAIEAALQLRYDFDPPADGHGPRLRTAVHRGTIIPVRRGELFGDGVHGVFRLRAAAEPGEICVSDTVVNATERPVGELTELTERSVTGVGRPLRCYRVEDPALTSHGAD